MNSTPDSTTTSIQGSAEEIAEVIEQFEQYRERLVSETMTTAKRAKLPKKEAMAKIEPELAKIDSALQTLRQQQSN